MINENIKAFIDYGKENQIENSQLIKNLILVFGFGLSGILLFNIFLKMCIVAVICIFIFISAYYKKIKLWKV